MKLLVSFGVFAFAMSFCGISERIAKLKGGDNSSTPSTTSSPSTTASPSSSNGTVEKAEMTSEQKAAIEGGETADWSDQGMSWNLPKGWKKQNVTKDMFTYGSPDNAFLIGTISTMADDFPSDISLKATYDSSMQQLKNGKYLTVRYVEIDGVKGVEWEEAPPSDKDGPRRHQWIAFRKYQGQNQQLNIMLSTKGSNFDKHKDDFPAVLYSMKIGK